MRLVWSTEIDEILKVGHRLTDIGLNNWALTRSQAFIAFDQLETLQIAILGGDVCQYINDRLQPNYDSWHCDQLQNENKSDFVSRSIKKAKDYIELYQPTSLDTFFFAIVPGW
jgi:hypothetical protein